MQQRRAPRIADKNLRSFGDQPGVKPRSDDCAPVGCPCAHLFALVSPSDTNSPHHGTRLPSSLDPELPRYTRNHTTLGPNSCHSITPSHHYWKMEVFGSLIDVCAILQDRLLSLLNDSPPNRRIIIALAGVPGSGKSTIAASLLAHLKRIGISDVVVAPMVYSNHVQSLTQFLLTLTGWLSLYKSDPVHICRSR